MTLLYIMLYGFIITSAGLFAWWDVARCRNRWRALCIGFVLPLGVYLLILAEVYGANPHIHTLASSIAASIPMLFIADTLGGNE